MQKLIIFLKNIIDLGRFSEVEKNQLTLALYILEKHYPSTSDLDIPIDIADVVSTISGYPEIVIFGYNPVTGINHVTTFGKTIAQSLDACNAGNFLKKALGWSDEDCKARPDLSKKCENCDEYVRKLALETLSENGKKKESL